MNINYGEAQEPADNINILEIINVLWDEKILIIFSTLTLAIFSILFSLSLPDKYESSILLTPAGESSQTSNLSSMSPLAGLAGISIPKGTNNASIGLEVLKSRIFVENFISEQDILVPLMASKNWDRKSGELILDSNIYDSSSKTWVRKSNPKKPSLHEAYDFWMNDVFSIDEDKETGFITVNLKHYSPIDTKNWLSALINDLNDYMRNIDVDEARLSIQYLKNETNKTTSQELRSLLYALIQSNTEKEMLAYSRSEYLFRIIDPPIVPEHKALPNRILIVFLGLITGTMIGIFIIFYRNRFLFFSSKK